MRFRESFVRVAKSKPGGVQLDFFREAGSGPTVSSCRLRLAASAGLSKRCTQNRRPDGVISTFNDLTSWRLFEPLLSPADFFRQSWIIDVHEGTRRATVHRVPDLDALYATRIAGRFRYRRARES